jgi:hypothetical protein
MAQQTKQLSTEEDSSTLENIKEDTAKKSKQLSEKCDTVIAKIKIKKAKK